jgi:hypothetical protein
MKKLLSLTARFADDVFRVLRGATLEELAELLNTPLPPAARARDSMPRAAPRPARPGRQPNPARAIARKAAWARAEEEEGESSPAPEPPAVAEITDPERLLRLEVAEPPTNSRPANTRTVERSESAESRVIARGLLEPPSDPPPSAEQPTATTAVLLRANEALVRASNAGIVIRRRKGA